MIKAIIFDFGSVIYKTNWASIDKDFEKKFGIQILLNEDEELIRIYNESDIGKEDFRKFFLKLGVKDIEKAVTYYKKLYSKHKILNKKMVEVVKRLKNEYKLFGYTDTKKEHFDSNLKYGLYKNFIKVFTSFEFGTRKAEHISFERLKKELIKFSLTPKECLFVDDYPPNIKSAKKIGFRTIIYKDFPKMNEFNKELKEKLI